MTLESNCKLLTLSEHNSLTLKPQEYSNSIIHLSLRPKSSLSVFSDCLNIFLISSTDSTVGNFLINFGV